MSPARLVTRKDDYSAIIEGYTSTLWVKDKASNSADLLGGQKNLGMSWANNT
jgi:hypothetical protein